MADRAVSDHPGVQAQLDRLALLSPGARHPRARADLRPARPARQSASGALPPVLHVAGTNGKGSTCAFLRAAIEAAGLDAHVYTSPHLVRFNERIRLAGRLIEDERARRPARRDARRRRRHGDRASSRRPPPPPSSPSRARPPTPASSRSGSAAGSTRPTSSPPRSSAASPSSASTTTPSSATGSSRSPPRKPASPSRACRWSPSSIPTASPRRVGEAAAAAGALWLPRGARWDADVERRPLALSRRDAAALDLPLPRLAGAHQAMNAALAVAMLRHQDRLDVPEPALRAAMGWADWPARLQRLAPGPLRDLLPAGRRALARRRPQSGGGARGRRLLPRPCPGRPAVPHRPRPARQQGRGRRAPALSRPRAHRPRRPGARPRPSRARPRSPRVAREAGPQRHARRTTSRPRSAGSPATPTARGRRSC